MPLPMIHISIARKIALTNKKLINNPRYYLGSIAPDAIHSRTGSGKIEKCRTHIRNNDSTWYDDIIKFALNHKNSNGKIEPFYVGYMVHILADLLWEVSVHSNIRAMMDADNIEKCKQSSIYYNEADQLDFELFKFCPWKNEVWRLLEEANALKVDELLTIEEVDKWRTKILRSYNAEERKHNDSIKYLSLNMIDDFINNASDRITEIVMYMPI